MVKSGQTKDDQWPDETDPVNWTEGWTTQPDERTDEPEGGPIGSDGPDGRRKARPLKNPTN